MKGEKYFKNVLIVGAICLLTLPSVQSATVDISSPEKIDIEENCEIDSKGTIYYKDCIVWIYGRCNRVWGALTWIFGFYCPLFKKSFWVQAIGEANESLNVLVRGGGVGTYYDYDTMLVHFQGANGFMYWGGKSILFSGNQIFMRCKADHVWVST